MAEPYNHAQAGNDDVFAYITTQENNWRTARVPLTRNKSWNMQEHIERCTSVANAWYFNGANDGNRPYDDLVTPIINVAFRSEGFDVKDIVPYVNDISENYKSFLVKKFHPQWARKNQLDTFIDDVVETSVIYDLVLVKNVNNARPEVVDLKTLAFCDQTDIMAGPICIKHQYTPAEMTEFKGKWSESAVNQAIALAVNEIEVSIAGNQKVKTPGKYVEVYELRGNLPESWLKEDGDPNKYTPQMWLVCYYNDKDGQKCGITLYSGEDKPLGDNFKALKIDRVRSKGRACGRSIVETLFEPQVWNNYAAIKLKALLDSAINIIITNSEELGNQKLSELKFNTILKQGKDDSTQMLNAPLQNITAFTNYQAKMSNDARVLGSASEASLGVAPVSGTPFALQSLVVQQGQGIHEYRQGKIASFFADILYPEWILPCLVEEMDNGKKFSEELTLDEMQEVASKMAKNKVEEIKAEMIFNGKIVTPETESQMQQDFITDFVSSGSRGFFEIMKGELKEIPVSVFINIKQKQKDMARQADAITNILREVLRNPQAFQQIPGVGKVFNELLENSNLSPIDFSQLITAPVVPPTPTEATNQ